MSIINIHPLASNIIYLYASGFLTFLFMGFIFYLIALKKKYICNSQDMWWENKVVGVDICHAICAPIFKITLRFVPVVVIYVTLLLFFTPTQINTFFTNGWGPLAHLPLFWQGFVYFVIYDFLHYWNHRLFHKKLFWPIHAVHHSAKEVDWTTAYRFHPLNLAFGSWLITSVIMLFGASPLNLIYTAPVEAFMAYFVHANLNFTFGPIKYIFVTPVFHRWHHTSESESAGKNFGSYFSLWDVLFGTFYVPINLLPDRYGIEECSIEENYFIHLIYPFSIWLKGLYKLLGIGKY
jgi:sterol desaturase/sphingolipid hydroxylase (fatty acid hydroxylase superfamily)